MSALRPGTSCPHLRGVVGAIAAAALSSAVGVSIQLPHDTADLAAARELCDDAAAEKTVAGEQFDRATWRLLRKVYGAPEQYYGLVDTHGDTIDTDREAAAALLEDHRARSEGALARLVANRTNGHDNFFREIGALDEETQVINRLYAGEGGVGEAADDLREARKTLAAIKAEVDRLAGHVDLRKTYAAGLWALTLLLAWLTIRLRR